MTEPLFAGARMKVQRARRFIQELEAAQDAFVDSKPFSAHFDYSSGERQLKVEWKAFGEEPGAIAGDAVHNMRTALDQMASELARLNGESDKGVYFPFADEKQKLNDAIKNKRFFKAGADAVDLLREVAPYRGGNDALRALHDLDIQDKHITLIGLGMDSRLHIEAAYNLDHRKDDRVSVTPKHVHFKFDALPFEGRGVVETLKELVELVDGILDAFAALPRT